MRRPKQLHLVGVAGLVVTAAGALGTYYQILGQKAIWLAVLFAGFVPVAVVLLSRAREAAQVLRTFGARWRIDDGKLTIGNTVNVALRTKTVHLLLDAIKSVFPQQYRSVMKDAGDYAGRSFAQDLRGELIMAGYTIAAQEGKSEQLLQTKLELWAKYDSTTGMGAFDVSQVEITAKGIYGQIRLKNCFLTDGVKTAEPNCFWMTGYLEGVIEGFLGVSLAIEESECAAKTRLGYCLFAVSQR